MTFADRIRKSMTPVPVEPSSLRAGATITSVDGRIFVVKSASAHRDGTTTIRVEETDKPFVFPPAASALAFVAP